MHPSKLIEYLGNPGSGEKLELVVTETSNGEPYCGWLADSTGNVVGRLHEFKFDFVHFDRPPSIDVLRAKFPKETAPRPKKLFISPFNTRFHYVGEWHDIGDYMRVAFGNSTDAKAVLTSSTKRIDLQLHAHQWSGIAMILVNGEEYSKVDLFNQDNPIPKVVVIENPDAGKLMTITVFPLCVQNPLSNSAQLIIEGAVEYLDETEMPTWRKVEGRNHGGAQFEEVFYQYISQLPPDAVILDIGGGKRQLNDLRYINLEYSQYEEPDMFADGQALPFKSGSVDLVYCTGVLEHIPNPLLASHEIYRVLKNGGRVLACIPFLQPLHNDPQHFFNATPFGVATLFAQFERKEIWWEGKFSEIIKWIAEAGRLNQLAEPDDWSNFCRLLEKLSPLVPYERLKFIASSTWVNAVKE